MADDAPLKVIILGCGRVGSTLAKQLALDGHSVTVIDLTKDSFRRLGPKFRGLRVVGTGLDRDTLEKAGIASADIFFAVTQGDNTNIMAAQVAMKVYQIPKVLARIYDPIRAQAYREMGIITFCTTTLAASILYSVALDRSDAAGLIETAQAWDRDYLSRLG
jgi:trk system potassium uptake protein TrkA